MHKPIFLEKIALCHLNKICFEGFSTTIRNGMRIAIIGDNGEGKSSLLRIIQGDLEPSEGEIRRDGEVVFGRVPQLITEYAQISGAERFHRAFSVALAAEPDVLLLDEPTNHLDRKNRQSLMRMLNGYTGTLVVVSHDEELLRTCVDTLWHIDNGVVRVFHGQYDDYQNTLSQEHAAIRRELGSLRREKQAAHQALMKEQERAAKSKKHGEKMVASKRWLPAVGDLKKNAAEKAGGKNSNQLNDKRHALNERLSAVRLPETVTPKFSLTAKEIGGKMLVSVMDGSVARADRLILQNINLSLHGGERLGIGGSNGSGKSTLFQALLNSSAVTRGGVWHTPSDNDVGYLDQHYRGLDDNKTVLETISEVLPQYSHQEIRLFLNDFLFRRNEEVQRKNQYLSGGERARLSLALLAAKTPKLLLLDEISNNLDLTTQNHVIQALNAYPGAMLVISHNAGFLEAIGITQCVDLDAHQINLSGQ